jgi:predicted TIM-barrel fold metal-dependent hydrolase
VTSADVVDTLCNAFTADRRELWDGAISSAGVQVKVRRDDGDSFADAATLVARMDELGVATVVLITGDTGRHALADPYDFEHLAARWDEMEELVARWPGRFAALALVDPERGMRGVRDLRLRLDLRWVIGSYTHTHSWDRRLDHADFYPYYAACADAGVPVAAQAGTSGGLLPSECGRPISVDRPALYFRDTPFVLSHLGWPWCDEAVAMALKFPNVYLGTGAYPPRHWPAPVLDFLRGPGRAKVMFATNFPTVGHRHALAQVAELALRSEVEADLLGGTARRVFTRLEQIGASS